MQDFFFKLKLNKNKTKQKNKTNIVACLKFPLKLTAYKFCRDVHPAHEITWKDNLNMHNSFFFFSQMPAMALTGKVIMNDSLQHLQKINK